MSPQANGRHTLVLYDGVCALCNGFVRFLLRHDRADEFRFASLQSEFARGVLQAHKMNAGELNTVVVVADYGGSNKRVLTKSSAALYAAGKLGGVGRLSAVARFVPRALRDFVYDLVARYRYHVFGRYDTCPLPSESQKSKFLS